MLDCPEQKYTSPSNSEESTSAGPPAEEEKVSEKGASEEGSGGKVTRHTPEASGGLEVYVTPFTHCAETVAAGPSVIKKPHTVLGLPRCKTE